MSESTLTDRTVSPDFERPLGPGSLAALRTRLAARGMVPIWLLLIVLLGGYFRLTGLDWDEGFHLHPDERFLSDVVGTIQWPEQDFLSSYFDEATSTLNPRNMGKTFFVYGDFPIILTKGITVLMDDVMPRADGGSWQSYSHNYKVGRALDALMDLGTLLVLFALARRLYRDDRIALLAALLYAGTALAIQQSHFFVVDSFTAFFVMVALYFLVRVYEEGRLLDYLLAGFFVGISLATKLSVFTLALMVGVVGAYRLFVVDSRQKGAEWATEHVALRVAVAGLAALVALRIFQPTAFSGLLSIAPRWWANAQEARAWVSGARDAPFAHQWTDRTIFWFPWKNMVLWGMGLPLGLTAWAGWGVATWQLLRRQRWIHLIPVAWVGIVWLHLGTQWVKSLRYFLPIYPMLVLLGAWLLVEGWDRARDYARREPGALAAALPRLAALLLVGVTGATLIYAYGFTSIYQRPHTRVEASRWIMENIPAGAVVANETFWDDGLPLRLPDYPAPNERFVTEIRGNSLDAATPAPLVSTTLNITDEDDPGKWYGRPDENGVIQPGIFDRLDQIDYYFISSNRQYDSMSRLPMRFPAVINFYDALFSGELGFERVAEFTSYPHFLGIPLPDQGAEEAWHVYDHNRVQVWKKTDAYSRERAEELILGDVDFSQIQQLWPRDVSGWAGTLTLDSRSWPLYREAGTWSQIFDRGSLANRFPLAAWVVVLQIVGLLGLPYAALVGRALPDRGYTLAKPLGLLLVGWLIWLLASLRLVTYSPGGIALAALVVGLGGIALLAVAARERAASPVALARGWLRREWKRLLVVEVVFFAFFALVLAVRWANPDLWHPALGGEKPMDMAYLNAIIKSPYFPPLDPWFGQGYINYYYFGFVLVGTLIQASGVVVEVAYNLALPTLFAMLAAGVWGVALALLAPIGRGRVGGRAVGFATLAALMVAVLGNLGELRVLLELLPQLSPLEFRSGIPGLERGIKALDGLVRGMIIEGRPLPGRMEWAYWNPTRTIPETINEFPWFTFLYADLHAHMMALPYTVLAIALSVAALRATRGEGVLADGLRLGLLALVVGALWPLNTWDFPTYALVAFGGLGLYEWRQTGSITAMGVVRVALRWGALLVIGRLMFQPFHANYGTAYNSVGLWRGERTGLGDFLIVHGLFLFAITGALLSDLFLGRGHNATVRWLRFWLRTFGGRGRAGALARRLVRPSFGMLVGLYTLFLALALASLAAIAGLVVPGLLLVLLALALALFFRARPEPLWQMALFMIILGLGLTLAVELVVLEGDIGRMNTVFKFYLQVWVLWGIAAAIGAARVAREIPRWQPELRPVWVGGFTLLLGIALLYPIFATHAKINDRFDRAVGPGLDGSAFLSRAVYFDRDQPIELRWDAAAFRWMQENVPGSPIVAEINTQPKLYGWGSRYTVWTGNPTIVGWDWHQRQQRAAARPEQVQTRIGDVVQAIYSGTDPALAHATLRRYDAEYLVVGPLERAYAAPEGIAKFEAARGTYWDLVYENPEVRIYRVLDEPR